MADSDPEDVEELEEGPEPPPRPGLGPLPRFPTLGRPPQIPPAENHPPADRQPAGEAPPLPPNPPAADEPSGPSPTARSSRASTDEVVDLKDLQAAARQFSDIAFVSLGQVMGAAEKRAKGLPAIDDKWRPTKAERAFVNEPAGRIAKRHMHADVTALDTIDGLMIAVGVGGFALRRAAGIEPLEDGE